MTDREKLIELIRDGVPCPDDGNPFEEERCASCRYCADVDCDFLRLADYLLANGVTVQEWISTDERMPTEDDATDGYVPVIYASADGVNTKTISLVDVVIKHPDLYDYWMPLNLPQPPKGEKGVYDPEDVIASIENAPAVEAVEVAHGRWEKAKYIEAPVYVCSECGNREPLPRKFCPECGMMMDGERE